MEDEAREGHRSFQLHLGRAQYQGGEPDGNLAAPNPMIQVFRHDSLDW